MKIIDISHGIYRIDGKLATENSVKGAKVYGEDLVMVDGKEYRLWNPYRSKLAAAIINGMKNISLLETDNVLYLGAATGTTASHVSDITKGGKVFCVELSERNMRDLLNVCGKRTNMLPILSDARLTERYSKYLPVCDVIYQDISSKDQAEILNKNSKFLKAGGIAYFIIKSQSIDISRNPENIYAEELAKLSKDFEILERIDLEPFDSLHLFTVLRKKDL